MAVGIVMFFYKEFSSVFVLLISLSGFYYVIGKNRKLRVLLLLLYVGLGVIYFTVIRHFLT